MPAGVHRTVTFATETGGMSMFEPLLPHPRTGENRSPAAEPGQGGPPPAAPEEPDVLPDDASAPDAEQQPGPPAETAFRTPHPGERLHPEELSDELSGHDGEPAGGDLA